jgi:predicted DNA-binding transcriptional regulator AlpA
MNILTVKDMNLLTLKDILAILKVSKSTIYKWIKEGKFPKPLKLERLSRWTEEMIHEFIF